MSYDLHVFARDQLSQERLFELLNEAGLAVEDPESAEVLTVVRGARRSYSFTLAAPVAVEQEDVPDEVTAFLLEPRFFYELLVEGSAEAEVKYAQKVARRLAQTAGGVVLDQQTGQVWKRGQLRIAPRVEEGLIATVNVRWYVRAAEDPGAAALIWTELSHRWMPELLPRRYGEFEPLQRKHDEGGDPAFADFVRHADGMVFFKTTRPALDGHVAAGQPRGISAHSVTFLRDSLNEPNWRAALRGFFTDFAARTDAVLATAEVQRGVQWSGRTVSYSGHTEPLTFLAVRGDWGGLPPYPVWWAFFGSEYAPLVADHLASDQLRWVGDRLFHWRSEAPADRDELTAALEPVSPTSRRGLFQRTAGARERRPWLPKELLAQVDLSNPRLHNPPLTPASVRPGASTSVGDDCPLCFAGAPPSETAAIRSVVPMCGCHIGWTLPPSGGRGRLVCGSMEGIVLRVRLISGDSMDVTYEERDVSSEDEVIDHVVSTLAEDSGVLRCRHGDRLLLLYARGVAAVEVAPRGAVL